MSDTISPLVCTFLTIAQAVIMALVPDEPEEITTQLARMEVITQKAIRHIPDDTLGVEETDSLAGEKAAQFNYNAHSYVWPVGSVRAVFTEEDGKVLEENSESKKVD